MTDLKLARSMAMSHEDWAVREVLQGLLSNIETLEKALKPFAEMAVWLPPTDTICRIRVSDSVDVKITGDDLHNAYAVLSNGDKP